MASHKKVPKQSKKNQKTITNVSVSTDREQSVWLFDQIDKNGPFSFDIYRPDFNHLEFMEKMIAYNNMTWREIINQTHDNGKSKNHFIGSSLSEAAKKRLQEIKRSDDSDALFSFAFTNKLRIVGIREGKLFHVLWYDPKHEAIISKKKHT